MSVSQRISARPRRRRRTGRAAFTLMEMMVVIGLVALVAALALPSVMALIDAGADIQSYNLMAAQLTAARARAIQDHAYTGIHVQWADARSGGEWIRGEKMRNVSFCAMVQRKRLVNQGPERFVLIGDPIRVPGSISFGKPDDAEIATPRNFTTLTVVFSPTGAAVQRIPGDDIVIFDPMDRAFAQGNVGGVDDPTGSTQLWDINNAAGDQPVTALRMFDVADYLLASNKGQYLEKNVQILALNIHTGQLMRRR